MSAKKVIVKQIRSLSGQDKWQRATVKALGLGRLGSSREFNLNPALVGMLKKVEHLVDIRPLTDGGK